MGAETGPITCDGKQIGTITFGLEEDFPVIGGLPSLA
jgi:hypothetical protein